MSSATDSGPCRSATRNVYVRLRAVVVAGILFGIAAVVRAQVPDSFNPGANGSVFALAVQADGKVLVGGHFTTLGGGGTGTTLRSNIGRLHPDGSVDTSFNPGANDYVWALAVQADGKILVGGRFTTLGGGGLGTTTRYHLGRLNTDGSLDTTFNPGANNDVFALAVQADGRILVSGWFARLGGGGFGTVPRLFIGRLNADGSIDTSFDPGANMFVMALALQEDGKILVGGGFTMLGGGTGTMPGDTGTTPRSHIGRLNADGSVDTSFDPGANADAEAFAVQRDGKIVVGGRFTTLGGGGSGTTPRSFIGRVNGDGSLDTSFDPGANSNQIEAFAIQTDGKILVGGRFTTLGGGGTGTTPRRNIGRVNVDGSVDVTFDPGANGGVSGGVYALAVQRDGRILAGGEFTGLGGVTGTTPRSRIGRITNTDAAVEHLKVSGGGRTLTWTRSGAAPEVWRVTFESSPDGVTYGPLGNGTSVAGGWQLADLSLPVNQTRYIRARGHYATGNANGSASTVESVAAEYVAMPALDLNGDGNDDVFTHSLSSGAWAVENTLAGGGFSPSTGAWAPGWSVTPAHFNGDGLTDVFLFNQSNHQWFKLLNDGAGGWITESFGYWGTNWQRFVVDLNGDDVSDLFLWDPTLGVWFTCMATTGGFTYTQGFWSLGWEVYPMRLNTDALADFFIFNRASGQWFWVAGDPGGGFTYPQFAAWAPTWMLYPGDYDADGLGDLFLHDPANGEWYVARNTAGTFTYTLGAFTIGWDIHPMDLDANGSSDLFLHNPANGEWFEMTSTNTGAFIVGGHSTFSLGWTLYPTDFNGDGREDLLLYNPTNGQWLQARNLALGTFDLSAGVWSPGLAIVAGQAAQPQY